MGIEIETPTEDGKYKVGIIHGGVTDAADKPIGTLSPDLLKAVRADMKTTPDGPPVIGAKGEAIIQNTFPAGVQQDGPAQAK